MLFPVEEGVKGADVCNVFLGPQISVFGPFPLLPPYTLILMDSYFDVIRTTITLLQYLHIEDPKIKIYYIHVSWGTKT